MAPQQLPRTPKFYSRCKKCDIEKPYGGWSHTPLVARRLIGTWPSWLGSLTINVCWFAETALWRQNDQSRFPDNDQEIRATVISLRGRRRAMFCNFKICLFVLVLLFLLSSTALFVLCHSHYTNSILHEEIDNTCIHKRTHTCKCMHSYLHRPAHIQNASRHSILAIRL